MTENSNATTEEKKPMPRVPAGAKTGGKKGASKSGRPAKKSGAKKGASRPAKAAKPAARRADKPALPPVAKSNNGRKKGALTNEEQAQLKTSADYALMLRHNEGLGTFEAAQKALNSEKDPLWKELYERNLAFIEDGAIELF